VNDGRSEDTEKEDGVRIDGTLRVTSDRRRADDWGLTLASAGILSRIDWTPDGYALSVRDADRRRADRVLAAFDAENEPRPAPSEPHEQRVSYGAVVAAVALCAFFVVTGPRDAGGYWFDRGAATASRIAGGEYWRTVTALTLHADFPHILSNAATMIIFGTSLCGLVGTGTGLWLMLLSGAAGNWLAALLRGAPYSAVGASTAIFGAIGALAAVQLMRRRRGVPVSAWRAWAPIAAGLALLAFLGTAPQTDVLAHLFGFGVGAGLGAAVMRARGPWQHGGLQTALSLAAVLVVVACWLLAIRNG
jgi:membrane associated rhomboid family serine protease